MAGGVKQRHLRPIVPGDALLITRSITDIYEKRGSSGALIFVVYDISVTDEGGELVMQQTQSRIIR